MKRREFIKRVSQVALGVCSFQAAGSLLLASSEPAPSPIHVVRSGDTLSHLARRYGVSVANIRRANGLEGDLIRVGQRLRIPVSGRAQSFVAPVKQQIDVSNFKASQWRHIIAHHSATPNGNAAIFGRFHRDHRRMPNGLGYHFIIGNGTNSKDGEIEVGNRWTRQIQGGHVSSLAYNRNSIGICLVGNFETQSPTKNQLDALTELLLYLKDDKLGGNCRFLVHRELETTLCPGRHFPTQEIHRLFT